MCCAHGALDGELARIRLPGGRLCADQLAVAAQVAEEWGDGHRLTSRGNLQLRGLTDSDAAGQALACRRSGLTGCCRHRSQTSSPHPWPDVSAVTAASMKRSPELDKKLRGGAAQGLSGRFLFGVDDGRATSSRIDPMSSLDGGPTAVPTSSSPITQSVPWPVPTPPPHCSPLPEAFADVRRFGLADPRARRAGAYRPCWSG